MLNVIKLIISYLGYSLFTLIIIGIVVKIYLKLGGAK